MRIQVKESYIQWALRTHMFHICRFNPPWIKSCVFFKFPESSKKQNLNLQCPGNSLHSIYIVLTTNIPTIYTVLGMITNPEMILIKYIGGCEYIYIRDLNILRFFCMQSIWEIIPHQYPWATVFKSCLHSTD